MSKMLNWWDLICSDIFVLADIEARDSAHLIIVLSYVVSGISTMLSVFCYTEFAIKIPVAGGSFAYLRVELGDFVAFIGGVAVARSWTSYFATLCNKNHVDFRIIVPNMGPDYGHLDPIAIGVLIVVTILTIYSTKGSSIFNYIAFVLHILVLFFIIIVALINVNPANYAHFTPFGVCGVFKASNVLFFAYIGFDAVSTMAKETTNPARDIPIGLVGSMVIRTILYCVLEVTLCLMQSYKTLDIDAPFSVVFTIIGIDWAKYIVVFGVLKGMTTVLLYATIGMLIATSVIAFFTRLEILANLLSISTLFIFMLVAIALLVRCYYVRGVTKKGNQIKLIGSIVLIVGSSAGISANWAVDGSWIGYAICFPLWVLGIVFLWLGVPQAKKPTFWGVPLVPWLPSLLIAINAVLPGTIDIASFIRFRIWTWFLLVYYILFGLHASYDTTKESEVKCGFKEWNNMEEGWENGVSTTLVSNLYV
ncbi:unnamed protein product [Lupinus luteus]|uniref:Cationic amino acid transporter C-terminal domain-containing protein n=1 Tax=Lupinus luteus TaxID=3873 RepID=A0AAV1WB87_LUPLU